MKPSAAAFANASKSLPLPDKPSIAVLPFQNMSGDPEQEYFADGIAEDVLTTLSKIQELMVIARNSSFVFKGQKRDIREIGRTLGVRYVLEGSVRKAGNRVRLAAQLIDSLNGGHVWADRFEGDLDDVFELQDRITQDIVAALEVRLTHGEQVRVWRKRSGSPLVYEHFLKSPEPVRQFCQAYPRAGPQRSGTGLSDQPHLFAGAFPVGLHSDRSGSLRLARPGDDL